MFACILLAVFLTGFVPLMQNTVLAQSEKDKKAAAPAPAPVIPVTVMEAKPVTVPTYGEFVGTIESIETVEIRARVDGYIEQKHFEAGQTVAVGDLLYVLDQRTYQADLMKAKAGVAKAQADLLFAREGVDVLRAESRLLQSKAQLMRARQDVERLTPLVREEAAPKQDLDHAVANAKVAESEVKAREAELKQEKLNQKTQISVAQAELENAKAVLRIADLNLEYTEIKAPVGGRIEESKVFLGGLATRNAPEPLTLLSPLDPIQVKVKIGEKDYLERIKKPLAENQKMQAKPSGASAFQLILADGTIYPYPGRFKTADRAVDPKTSTLAVTLDFPNPNGLLLPGTFSRIRFKTAERQNVMLIPQRSVMDMQGIRTVYVVEKNGTVAAKTVTTGERVGSMWEIQKGLNEGDKVIVEGIQKVQPGVKVQAQAAPPIKPEEIAPPEPAAATAPPAEAKQ